MYGPLFLSVPFPRIDNIELLSMEEELQSDFNFNKPKTLSKHTKIKYRSLLNDYLLFRDTANETNINKKAKVNMICGILYANLYDGTKAIECFTEAEMLYTKLRDYEKLCLCYHYLSNIYLLCSFNNFNMTLYFYNLCDEDSIDSSLIDLSYDNNTKFLNTLSKISDVKNTIQYCIGYFNMSILLKIRGIYKRSQMYIRDALTVALSLPSEGANNQLLAVTFASLAMTDLALGKLIDAKDSFYDALGICSKYKFDDIKISIFIKFSDILVIENKTTEAVEYINKAKEIAERFGLPYTLEMISLKLKQASKQYRIP